MVAAKKRAAALEARYKIDADGDGIDDKTEAAMGLDPHSIDSDGDGLTDSDDINFYKTDPKNADTDGDGMKDGLEVRLRRDPLKPDTKK